MLQSLVLALMLGGTLPAMAADGADPDWPCIQRKQPHLSIGQVWSGPVPDAAVQALAAEPAIAALAARLALRRTPMPEAEAAIADFARGADAPRLTALFLATFDRINSDRDRVMAGIGRYASKQEALEVEIEDRRQTLARLTAAQPQDFDAIDLAEKDVDWSTRIFQERQQSLTYVCETPVILEQRAFAIGRAVAGHLP